MVLRIIKLFITFDAYNPNTGVPEQLKILLAGKSVCKLNRFTNNFNPIWKRILSGLWTPKATFTLIYTSTITIAIAAHTVITQPLLILVAVALESFPWP